MLTGISKGGFGGGAGGAATPLLAMVIPPAQGAAIMLPVLCVIDVFGIRAYLWRWDARLVRITVSGGLIGCAAGALAFGHLDDDWIRILVGLTALGFLAYSLLPRKPLPAPSDRQGWFWCALSGFTSFITHSGGAPLMVYLLPQKLDKAVFVATSLVFFAAMNYVKILPYLWLGLLDARNLATSAALVPAGVAGIYLGLRLQRRISARWFYRLIYGLLFITGVKLLYDGLT